MTKKECEAIFNAAAVARPAEVMDVCQALQRAMGILSIPNLRLEVPIKQMSDGKFLALLGKWEKLLKEWEGEDDKG